MATEFFEELREWSERKLRLLDKYLDASVKILGSINQVYYVDGFAGVGEYGDGAKGSPLRAAELAESIAQANKPYALRCINVEAEQSNFDNLVKHTARFGSLVLNIHGTFSDNIDLILKTIGRRPAVFFLDPFGIKGVEWSAVKRIIDRPAPTDVWIRFDTRLVRRLSGFFESGARDAKGKLDLLVRIYGMDQDSLYQRLSGATPTERLERALQLYMERLESEFRNGSGGYTGAYLIRSLEEQDKYWLVMATGHPKGFVLASNIIYGIEETYQREVQEYKDGRQSKDGQPRQLPFFFATPPTPEQIFESKVGQLQEDIWEAGQGQTMSRRMIHTAVMGKWFGRIRGPHVTEALKQLQSNGKIMQVTGSISNEDTSITFSN